MPGNAFDQLMDGVLKGTIDLNYVLDDPDSPNLRGATLLHIAAGLGRMDVVKKLLKENVDVDPTMSRGETPLHIALVNKQYDTAVALLNHGADPNAKLENGNTPLHFAVRCEMKLDQHLKIIQLLLEKGTDPLGKNEKGITPLHFAVSVTHTEVMDVLLQQPLPLDHLSNESGDTPLSLAVKANDQNMQDKLLTFGMTMNENDVAAKKELEQQQTYDADLSADHLIIVDLTDNEGMVNRLRQRWYLNHRGECFLVSKENLLNHEKKISGTPQCNSRIKIYVIGHHDVGEDYIRDTANKESARRLTYRELATGLNYLIGDYDESNVVINLISCEAARSCEDGNPRYDSGKNSLAAKLQHDLVTQHDQNIPVIARTEAVIISNSNDVFSLGSKATYPSNATPEDDLHRPDYISKQPITKMLFIHNEQKEQIKVDAYSARWKGRMLKLLNHMHEQTQVPAKRKLLNEWLNGSKPFKDLSSDEIFTQLEDALKVGSKDRKTLETYTNSLFSFTYTSPQTSIDNIIALMDERRNAIKHSVKTGLKAQDEELIEELPLSSTGESKLTK